MKITLTTLLFFLTFNTIFSQEFTYKKVFSSDVLIRIKGSVMVTDSLITIITENAPTAPIKVVKKLDTGGFKQFRSGESENIRITLNNLLKSNKKEPVTLLMELKDDFTGTISTVIYYLEPKK